MSAIDDDNGITIFTPSPEFQAIEREQRRLIYGQFSKAELKRKVPDAFEPSQFMLFMMFVEKKRAITFYTEVRERLKPNDHHFKTELSYVILAHKRSAEDVERKLKKELQSLGFSKGDEIDSTMMKLAEETYDTMPTELRSYLLNNSPAITALVDKY